MISYRHDPDLPALTGRPKKPLSMRKWSALLKRRDILKRELLSIERRMAELNRRRAAEPSLDVAA